MNSILTETVVDGAMIPSYKFLWCLYLLADGGYSLAIHAHLLRMALALEST